MISEADISKAREKFFQAAKDFNFVFHSPFSLSDDCSVFGFTENYGSKNGTVICMVSSSPSFPNRQDVVRLCEQMEYFVSFLNITPLLGEYNASYFREMLRDWKKH